MDDLLLSRLDLSLIVRTGLSCKGLQSGKGTFKLTALVVVPPQTVYSACVRLPYSSVAVRFWMSVRSGPSSEFRSLPASALFCDESV
jgi:hypothetical protein